MERVLFTNQFLALIDRDGYTFAREVRCNGAIIAVLPFRDTPAGRHYLARRETCPAHASVDQQPELCSITGGIDADRTPLETARAELLEEAGYAVELGDFIALGTLKPSKSMDTVVHLFGINVGGKRERAVTGDGSKWEVGASVVWLSERQGIEIGDPLFIAALARLRSRTG